MTALRRAAPWLVALFGVALAVIILVEARARVALTDERDSRLYTSRAASPLVQELREQREAGAVAAVTSSVTGTRDVGVADPEGPTPEVAALARDTGKPVIDDRAGGAVVVARYEPAGPTNVAARRAQLVGFTLVPLELDAVLESADDGYGAIALRGPEATVATSEGYDAIADDAVEYTASLAASVGPGWRIEVVTPHSPLPGVAWALAGLVILAGAGGAFFAWRRISAAVVAEAAALRRSESDATLAELSTVSQSSLDLAEVLPASFAVLETGLELEGASLVGTDARPTFVWRDAPADDEPTQPLEAPVPAGSCVAVPLARGGRSLGALRVRPHRALDELDLRTLNGAAETLSAAVANSDAYAHQRSLITRMRSLDDLKTVFVATASHELRTPVAAIIGYSNMLTENWDELDSDTGRLYATRVENNAQRLAALVENLLDFSRLEQGVAQSAAKEMLDLGAEVRALMEAQTDLTPNHQVQITAQPGLVVFGSRLAIERVVTNLVGNAAKYSPAGTTIRVRVEGGGTVARLLVDDEGPGVPEHEREQIFSRFFRGKGDAVTRTQGAGLGLSIVTEFASSMGGEVAILAAPTGGTRFEVNYPLAKPRVAVPTLDEGDSDDPA